MHISHDLIATRSYFSYEFSVKCGFETEKVRGGGGHKISTRAGLYYRVGGFWVESDFFVRLQMSTWISFYITLLKWEFLLKW